MGSHFCYDLLKRKQKIFDIPDVADGC